jgi:enoyl-CoA hydratase/carnithine racemase
MTDAMTDLEYTVKDGIGTILLNRPEMKNAFTFEMIDRWAESLRSARTDPEVRVVVVTGAGDAFCSGVDLDEFTNAASGPFQLKSLLTERIHRVAYALEDLDKPVIAAVNGTAVGAGMDMALMCDIRLLASSARMSEGYIRVGLVPGDGGCYYLPRLVGMAKALELLWTGDFLDAEEALRLGVANHVYPDEDFAGAWTAFARRIAEQPPINVQMIKRAAYQSARSDVRTALDLISSHMAVVHSTRDSAEAMAAFRGRRAPRFEGR